MLPKYATYFDDDGTKRVVRRAYTDTELLQHFWESFTVVDHGYITPCWEWSMTRGRRGYGQFTHHGKIKKAHRFAWEISFGPIPDGLYTCHKCDNPPCIRPDHLFLGTNHDNQVDSARKFRGGHQKLTAYDVTEIRNLAKSGTARTDLAERFRVSEWHISNIVKRRLWKHLV